MIVDVLSAVTYAQHKANSYNEPMTIYYVPYHNIYAFGKIGSLPIVQHMYPGLDVVKITTLDPETWNLDIEE